MSVILSLLGIVLAAVGIAAIGFGIPINEFTLGTTLIVAGVSALTGGLILIGLAAVVAELGRLAEAVRTRIAVRPGARPAEAPEAVEPAASTTAVPPPPMVAVGARSPQTASRRPRAEAPVSEARPHEPAAELPEVEVSAPAVERLRASIPRAERSTAEPSILAHDEEVPLSPNGAAPLQTRSPGVEAAPPEPKISADDRAGGAAVEALKASRLDFLFRSKPTRPASQRENFDAVWPTDARAAKRTESEPDGRRSGSTPGGPSCIRARSPAGARVARRATRRGHDPQIRRRRRHGLYALHRRIDRGQATGRDGQVRLDRRTARAYRAQLVGDDAFEIALSAMLPARWSCSCASRFSLRRRS